MIRPGYYWWGSDIEISGGFTSATGESIDTLTAKLYVRKGDAEIPEEIELTPINGQISYRMLADQIGTWRFRLESVSPSHAVVESRIEVVPSTVLPLS